MRRTVCVCVTIATRSPPAAESERLYRAVRASLPRSPSVSTAQSERLYRAVRASLPRSPSVSTVPSERLYRAVRASLPRRPSVSTAPSERLYRAVRASLPRSPSVSTAQSERLYRANEDINVRRDCVLRCLSIYLNEDLDTLVKEYMVKGFIGKRAVYALSPEIPPS
uniref:Uncharacterized protein n=1 Tax=Knipowitschia caucasica TaxID=637954 RepID=A0AAV2IY65_KNICA